jgi:hypothetical protein
VRSSFHAKTSSRSSRSVRSRCKSWPLGGGLANRALCGSRKPEKKALPASGVPIRSLALRDVCCPLDLAQEHQRLWCGTSAGLHLTYGGQSDSGARQWCSGPYHRQTLCQRTPPILDHCLPGALAIRADIALPVLHDLMMFQVPEQTAAITAALAGVGSVLIFDLLKLMPAVQRTLDAARG